MSGHRPPPRGPGARGSGGRRGLGEAGGPRPRSPQTGGRYGCGEEGGGRGGCTPRLTEEAAPRGLRREPYLPCPPWRGGGSGAAAGTRGGLGWVGLGWVGLSEAGGRPVPPLPARTPPAAVLLFPAPAACRSGAAHPFARQRRPIVARRRDAAANRREARGGDTGQASAPGGHVGGRPGRRRAGEEEEEGAGEAPLGAAIFRRGTPPSLTLKAAALRAEGWLCGGRGRGPGPGSGAGRSVAEAAVSFGHHDRVGSGWERTGLDWTGACVGPRLGPPLLTGLPRDLRSIPSLLLGY